jgi:hypothetical protein
MGKNIKDAVKRFERFGMTTKNYLSNALRFPILFSMSANTVEKNIKNIAQTFAYDGLTVDELFHCAQSSPQIYILKAKSIEKNVEKISKTLDVPRYNIIETFKKQPSTFVINPKMFIKKFKILKYIEENKIFDKQIKPLNEDELKLLTLRKSFTNSIESNYLLLLKNKISSNTKLNTKLPQKHVKENLTEFIKNNQNKIINIEIPNGDFAKDFKSFSKDFSKSIIGKNIFKIKIV